MPCEPISGQPPPGNRSSCAHRAWRSDESSHRSHSGTSLPGSGSLERPPAPRPGRPSCYGTTVSGRVTPRSTWVTAQTCALILERLKVCRHGHPPAPLLPQRHALHHMTGPITPRSASQEFYGCGSPELSDPIRTRRFRGRRGQPGLQGLTRRYVAATTEDLYVGPTDSRPAQGRRSGWTIQTLGSQCDPRSADRSI